MGTILLRNPIELNLKFVLKQFNMSEGELSRILYYCERPWGRRSWALVFWIYEVFDLSFVLFKYSLSCSKVIPWISCEILSLISLKVLTVSNSLIFYQSFSLSPTISLGERISKVEYPNPKFIDCNHKLQEIGNAFRKRKLNLAMIRQPSEKLNKPAELII